MEPPIPPDGKDAPAPVRRRVVVHIGGYDPKSPEAFFARLEKEAARFERTWDVTVVPEGDVLAVTPDIHARDYRTSSETEGWTVRTRVHQLTLDDIVLSGFQDPWWRRAGRWLAAFARFWTAGVGFALLRHAWRFWLYFAYPLAILLLGAGAIALTASFGWAVWPPLALAFGGVTAWWMVVRLLPRSHALHLMDLWTFSLRYIEGREPRIEAKLEALADVIASAGSEEGVDEVLLVGHSTGGALILDAAARSLDRPGAGPERLAVMTVGSTALKVGLHPAGAWFRQRVGRLIDAGVPWYEFQALSDAINLYRTNPAALMGHRAEGVQVRRVRISRMVSDEMWRRMRRNFFRIHYQFVFANTRRVGYDYFAALFGPLTLEGRDAARPRSEERLDGRTGNLTETERHVP